MCVFLLWLREIHIIYDTNDVALARYSTLYRVLLLLNPRYTILVDEYIKSRRRRLSQSQNPGTQRVTL